MRCSQCGMEMRQWGEAMKCESCLYTLEQNGLVASDRPEEGVE